MKVGRYVITAVAMASNVIIHDTDSGWSVPIQQILKSGLQTELKLT